MHCIGCFLVIYLFLVFGCVSVESESEGQDQYCDDQYYYPQSQGKRKPPSLSISLILCFSPSILSTIILHAIPCLLQIIRVSYQLHEYHTHYLFSLLISIGLMCWPEYHYICYYKYA